MNRIVAALDRWWFTDAPAERLAAIRILVGGFATVYLFTRMGEIYQVATLAKTSFASVGPTRLLHGPLPPALALAFAVGALACCGAMTIGAAYRITAPLAALGMLWVTAYRNSWGMVFHTENLLVLQLAVLAIAPAAAAWKPFGAPDQTWSRAGYGWPIKLLAAVTCATYVLAGVAKLRIAGFAWADGELLRNQVAVDNLRKVVLGDAIAPLATQLLEHPNGFIGFAALTLVIELGSPVIVFGDLILGARWGGRLSRLWAFGAWGFHVGVVLMMNIWFPFPLSAVPYATVFRPERGMRWLGVRLSRLGNKLLPSKLQS
jgi:hypothetical protein